MCFFLNHTCYYKSGCRKISKNIMLYKLNVSMNLQNRVKDKWRHEALYQKNL